MFLTERIVHTYIKKRNTINNWDKLTLTAMFCVPRNDFTTYQYEAYHQDKWLIVPPWQVTNLALFTYDFSIVWVSYHGGSYFPT